MINLRYPVMKVPNKGKKHTGPGGMVEITDPQPSEPIAQIQSYLYQLVDDLNYALNTIEMQASGARENTTSAAATGGSEEKKAQTSFNAIKSLIIKSADIVDAYYEEINKRLEGLYVAQSDYGTFVEQTTQDIKATSTGISQLYTNLQQIITDIEGLEHTLIEVNAHINSGILYYDESGIPVYGLEIGQRSEIDGEEVFNKYARFTSDKLSFFDSNGNEVAYISDKKLYITHVEITGSLTLGGFVDTVLSDKSVVTRWVVGGDE